MPGPATCSAPRFRPGRGDVVVFEDPGGWLSGTEAGPTSGLSSVLSRVGLYPTGGHLVKRVIGVAGDTVVCCDEQGRISVNGVALDENAFIRDQPDCDGPMPNDCSADWTVERVPEGMLFVMGDNRSASADSSARLCGPRQQGCSPERAFAPVDLVVGKVFSLVWPLDHARLVGRPGGSTTSTTQTEHGPPPRQLSLLRQGVRHRADRRKVGSARPLLA